MHHSVAVLLYFTSNSVLSWNILYDRPSVRCSEQCNVSGVCTAGTGVTDAHQNMTTERVVAYLAPLVFMRSHFQIWTFYSLYWRVFSVKSSGIIHENMCGPPDVFFRLVTYKSLWNVALYKNTVWEKWPVCPRSSYNFRRVAAYIVR
jgi:hypothetical protein